MTYQIKGTITCIKCGGGAAVARKLCRPCYAKLWRSGNLKQYKILGPSDVFLNRIKKTDTCWLWLGTKNEYGYGIFLMPGEIPVRAHRYAYEFFNRKKIPAGKIIMHTCDNPPCVNPDHLRVGTKSDNNADTAIKRRHHYGTDHWNGRLSNQDIFTIRKSTKKQVELARIFGVDASHISRIKSGESRK